MFMTIEKLNILPWKKVGVGGQWGLWKQQHFNETQNWRYTQIAAMLEQKGRSKHKVDKQIWNSKQSMELKN